MYKIKNLIHASTSSVYGNSTKKSFDIGDETDKPYSNYAASKKSSEVLLYAFHKLNKINITILRFFTVYGPYGRPDMSPFIFIESNLRKNKINLFGTGNQQRDFTYIDDIVSGIYKCRRLKNYNILNLGNNKPVKINLLLEKIEKFSNFKNLVHKLPALIEDVKYTSANINKTKSLIKWEPITKFEKGIKKTFDWHIENGKMVKKDKNIIINLAKLSKYFGQRYDLIQAAGGNSSIKVDKKMFIKSSGYSLAELSISNGYSKVDNQILVDYLSKVKNKEITRNEEDKSFKILKKFLDIWG